MGGPDFAEIRAALCDRIESLVAELVPEGHRNGAYWIAKNPTRADRHAGSFWVRVRNPAIGAWRDEAGVRGVDDGDVIDLVRYVKRFGDLKETRAWCLRWLGWTAGGVPAMTPAEKERLLLQRRQALEREIREEEERRKKAGRRALGLWLMADEITPTNFPGSILDRYLRFRSIDITTGIIRTGRALPGALRFFAAHDYFTADGEVLSFPCMAALMTGANGKPQALHRTWLRPDGSGKAELPDPDDNGPRKIWGPPKGAVIRISKGAGNMTPEEAARRGHRGPLIVTEGIEDALAVMLAMPDHRVWAAGALGNIGNVPVLPCVSSITVCRDNDWDKPQAVKNFETAIAQLKRSGRRVFVAKSPRGKDMNDLLKGENA